MDNNISLAIIGGRNFHDYILLSREVKLFTSGLSISQIISGGAKGADSLGECYAIEYGIPIKILYPDWNKYGRSAGILRNSDIIRESTHVIAFWDGLSKGTKDSINKAQTQNKILKIVYFNII
jgi:hypothetical protein